MVKFIFPNSAPAGQERPKRTIKNNKNFQLNLDYYKNFNLFIINYNKYKKQMKLKIFCIPDLLYNNFHVVIAKNVDSLHFIDWN